MRQTLFYSAIWLPLLETAVDARAHAKFPQLQVRDGRLVPEAKPVGWVDEWMGRLFKRGTCYEDSYYNFVQGLPQSFCQTYMNYPNQTVTVEYTPTRRVRCNYHCADRALTSVAHTPTPTQPKSSRALFWSELHHTLRLPLCRMPSVTLTLRLLLARSFPDPR